MHTLNRFGADLVCFNYTVLSAVGDVRELAQRMHAVYAAGLKGIIVPLRSSIQGDDPFFAFDTMPAFSEAHQLFVAKLGAVVPQNDPAQRSVHALVAAFSATSGQPIGIFDGDAVTHLKCAAVAVFVTDLCTSPKASVLGLIGSGVQASVQLAAAAAVRPLERVNIYSRNAERVATFVREHQPRFPEIRLHACRNADEVAQDADIISTATTATAPLLSASVLNHAGLHINCFGNHTPVSREIPAEVLAQDSIVIVEDIQTAVEEAGEVHRSAYSLEQLCILDQSRLRQQRTVFSSTGHAFLDLLAVDHFIEKLGL